MSVRDGMLSMATSTLPESSLPESSLRNALTGATVTFSRTVKGWKTRSKSDSLILGGLPVLGESAASEKEDVRESAEARSERR